MMQNLRRVDGTHHANTAMRRDRTVEINGIGILYCNGKGATAGYNTWWAGIKAIAGRLAGAAKGTLDNVVFGIGKLKDNTEMPS